MNRIAASILSIWCALNASAQEFGTHWISYPEPDSTSQIWFRQTYLASERPAQASITVTSTGYFELFVNEYNVSTDALIPYRKETADNPISITYDVTRFLRRDSNTVAVWYAPSYPHINTRQVAISYYGRTKSGGFFSCNSDKNWICHKAHISLTNDGNELMDGEIYPLKWNANNIDYACWLSADEVVNTKSGPIKELSSFYPAQKVIKIHQPTAFEIEGDSILYDFGTTFSGWIRVTLRGTRSREIIHIGRLEYVCNGTTDEQGYSKFTTTEYRRLIICGDEHFKPEQVQKVEGIEIANSNHHSYRY